MTTRKPAASARAASASARGRRAALALLAPLCCLSVPARALTLVEDGKSDARIYVAPDSPGDVRDAAGELSRVLERMSGARLPVETGSPTAAVGRAAPGIVLGALAEEMGLRMERTSRARDGCRFKVQGGHVLIVGESPAGVYTGVMRFLESLGCGWYTPGEVGEVIPSRPTVAVPDSTDRTDLSDSVNRRFWYGGKPGTDASTVAWLRRLNGGNLVSGSWRHAYGHLVPRDEMKDHPEYGSLRSGKRTTRQLCTTNPEVVRIAAETLLKDMAEGRALVFAAGPNDGGGLCECGECAKLDTPGYLEPSSGKPACSDRIFAFAAKLAETTSRKYPDRDLGILVYSEYSRVPARMRRMSPNVFPMIAPIRRCRIHGPGNPGCEMNMLLREEIRGWAGLGRKLGFYVYNYNLADTLMPFSKVDYYRRLGAELEREDVEELAWVLESIDSWAMLAPVHYLSVRASWNSRIDVDAEMDRFHRGLYGAAYGPMKSYWTRIDETYATTPTHTGSCFGMHRFWTPPMLARSRADIESAKALAATPREKDAVAMAEAGLVCAELFIRAWDAVAWFDFAEAARAQADLASHVKGMAARSDPNWVHERYAFTQYFRRFFGATIDGGAKALAGGGRIVVRLPDVWRFALDEKAVGVGEGWHRPGFDTASWRDMGTMSTSWVDEGLTWYQGDAWYRTAFAVPAAFKGRDLRLWFGGFDFNVDVYLNGRHLGEKRGFALPAEFDGIAPRLRFEGEETLAVRVSAGDLAEIGTGGLMMPVMIYEAGAAPEGGAPAPKDKAYEM